MNFAKFGENISRLLTQHSYSRLRKNFSSTCPIVRPIASECVSPSSASRFAASSENARRCIRTCTRPRRESIVVRCISHACFSFRDIYPFAEADRYHVLARAKIIAEKRSARSPAVRYWTPALLIAVSGRAMSPHGLTVAFLWTAGTIARGKEGRKIAETTALSRRSPSAANRGEDRDIAVNYMFPPSTQTCVRIFGRYSRVRCSTINNCAIIIMLMRRSRG